jgi:hypothetical protein
MTDPSGYAKTLALPAGFVLPAKIAEIAGSARDEP